jgi:hypothetical protein
MKKSFNPKCILLRVCQLCYQEPTCSPLAEWRGGLL